MRLVDADALIAQIEENICKPCIERKEDYHRVRCRACQYGDEINDIDSAPTIEPKKGKWRRRLVDCGFNADWHCSRCGWKTSLEEHGYNFCPNCGADMRGEEDEVN